MRSQPSITDVLERLREAKVPNSRNLVTAFLFLFGISAVWSAVYTVAAEEVGVVLTFGKYTRQADPGLRLKWPWPIQTVMKVPVQRQLKAEFGFRTADAGVRTRYSEGLFTDESLML
ncbi:MAG: SPFH domain-containing protein, partial [Gemmatimonadota bacterium]|nr:SPFH domain-containing protein [Gemmatimonadota bacterium]